MRTAAKLGVTEKEVDKLCAAIDKALAKRPLAPDELRDAVGGAARSLGPEGVKKGLSTTLPLGLGRLQTQGRIRRVPVNGRLDQQRYKYARWDPSPLAKLHALARRGAHRAGAASTSAGSARRRWPSSSGSPASGVKAAKAAIEPLKLGAARRRQRAPDAHRAISRRCARSSGRRIRSTRWSAASTRSCSCAATCRACSTTRTRPRPVVEDKTRVAAGSITDLPSHGIFDRGRLSGCGSTTPTRTTIAWADVRREGQGAEGRGGAHRSVRARRSRRRPQLQPRQPEEPRARIAALRKASRRPTG